MCTNTPESSPAQSPDWEYDDFEIPPFPRAPKNGTREATEDMVMSIDIKIAKLATLGLRAHPIMLGYRKELVEQLDRNGPYRLRVSSGWF